MPSLIAATRTLDTPELLEHILLQLPEHDLLLAQLVCKAWEALISGSPALQTALYFRVPTTYPADEYALNPFITAAFPFLLTPDHVLSAAEEADWRIKCWFNDIDPAPFPPMKGNAKAFVTSLWTLNPDAWRRPEASWRRMYVCNPPVNRIHVVHTGSSMGGLGISVATVDFRAGKGCGWIQCDGERVELEKENGLKMGLLYDYLRMTVCAHDVQHFRMVFRLNDGVAGNDVDEDTAKAIQDVADETRVSGSSAPEKSIGEEERDVNGDLGAKIQGVTLSMKFHSIFPCVREYGLSFPGYESDAFQNVEFGPFKHKSRMWDEMEDDDLYL